MTPVRLKLINAYVDWRDFGIRPWDRRLPAEEIPQFWKDVLRSFRRLESEVEQDRMKRNQDAKAAGKKIPGQAPSEDAKKDYNKWRKKQLKAQQKQQEGHHVFLQAQAYKRQKEYQKRLQRQQQLRKPRRPKRGRRAH